MSIETPIPDETEVGFVEIAGAGYFPSPLIDETGAVINPATAEGIAAVTAGVALVAAAVSELSETITSLDEQTYTLATATNIASDGTTTAVTDLQGGSYIWSVVAANFNSATITLQALAADGTTWLPVATATVNENEGVVIGQGGSVRLKATGGAPTGVSSSLT